MSWLGLCLTISYLVTIPGSKPQYGDTVYIAEVTGTRRVKSDAQPAMNKNLDTVKNFSLGVAGEDSAPNSMDGNGFREFTSDVDRMF